MEVDIEKESAEESVVVDNADVPLSSGDTAVLPDDSTEINHLTELPCSSTETVDDATNVSSSNSGCTESEETTEDATVPSIQDYSTEINLPCSSTETVDAATNVSSSTGCTESEETTGDATVPSIQDEMNVTSSDNYLQELYHEKELLDPRKCMHTIKLLEDEINRISAEFRMPVSMLNKQRPFDNDERDHTNLTEKVFFPIDECPSHNFVVKLLGPKGSNLKNIATYTKTKISILGKGSTRDQAREEELSKCNDPQHAHFNEPLHVLIQAAGPKYTAQSHLNSAVNEIKMYMEDEISSCRSKEPIDPYESRRPFDNDPHEYINLSEKVVVPVKENQTYQFVSRLLGPKGSNLKGIATTTKTMISILGQGSTRDKSKEQELRTSNDPKHQHFKEPLHVIVQVAGPRHTAQVRLNAALKEIKMYIDDNVNHVESQDPSYVKGQRLFDFEESVNLREKIYFPVDEYPSNNFVGRLLGPKGSNLRNIAASTKTRISILGKGSTRNKAKEAELSNSNDPKHEHFKEPLHVLIQVAGPKYASQGRLNSAVVEINRYIEDEIHCIDQITGNSASSLKLRRPFDNEEYVNLNEKVFFPVNEYPSYNFIGKLLGPKGSNLKSIAASSQTSTTKTRISILGKGSTRNPGKEEELGKSNDPQYQHFKESLHVEIHVSGPKYAAQVRLNAALSEIKKYTDPKHFEEKQMNEYATLHNPAAHSIDSRQETFSRTEKLSPDRRSPSHQNILNKTTEWSGDKSYDTTNNDDYDKRNDIFNYDNYTYGNKRPITSDDYLSPMTSHNYSSMPEKRFKDSCDGGDSYFGIDDPYGCSY